MNRKGITLVMLVITIIVILIIATIVILETDDLTKDAKALELTNNMIQIKAKVDVETYNMEDYQKQNADDEYVLKGELLQTTEIIDGVTYPISGEEGNWYRFSDDNTTYPNAVSLEQIGVYGITGTYLVNYATGKIVSKEGVKVENVRYHTLDSLMNLYNLDV